MSLTDMKALISRLRRHVAYSLALHVARLRHAPETFVKQVSSPQGRRRRIEVTAECNIQPDMIRRCVRERVHLSLSSEVV